METIIHDKSNEVEMIIMPQLESVSFYFRHKNGILSFYPPKSPGILLWSPSEMRKMANALLGYANVVERQNNENK